MGFQTQVNLQPAPGVEGDFATANPRASLPTPEGALVAGSGGVTIGQFAWVQADGRTVKNSPAAGSPAPDGFVHREQQGLITTYLSESSMLIPEGFPVTLMTSGDYYDKATVAGATKGQKAFAKLTDGTMQAAAAGATVAGYVETAFSITVGAAVGELAIISK